MFSTRERCVFAFFVTHGYETMVFHSVLSSKCLYRHIGGWSILFTLCIIRPLILTARTIFHVPSATGNCDVNVMAHFPSNMIYGQ